MTSNRPVLISDKRSICVRCQPSFWSYDNHGILCKSQLGTNVAETPHSQNEEVIN